MAMNPSFLYLLDTNSIILIVLEVLAQVIFLQMTGVYLEYSEETYIDTFEEEVLGSWGKTVIHFALYIPFYCLRTFKKTKTKNHVPFPARFRNSAGTSTLESCYQSTTSTNFPSLMLKRALKC